MDDLLPMTMYDFVICSFMVTGGTLIIFFVNPWVIIRFAVVAVQISCAHVRRAALFGCVFRTSSGRSCSVLVQGSARCCRIY